MNELRTQLNDLKIKLKTLKTRTAQNKVLIKMRTIENQIIDELFKIIKTCGTVSVKGVVVWTDSETVAVDTVYGRVHAYALNDVLSKSWYSTTCCIEYKKGQEIVIELSFEVDTNNLCISVRPGKIYGGTVNEAKYIELCQRNDLAFFKKPNGETTGLFQTEKAV